MALFSKRKSEPVFVQYEDIPRIFFKAKKNDRFVVEFNGLSRIQVDKKVNEITYKLVNLEVSEEVTQMPSGALRVILKKTS